MVKLSTGGLLALQEQDQRLVAYRLDKLDLHLESINEKLDNIIEHQHKLDKRQAISEVKSGIFGTLGGLLSVSLLLLREWFKTHIKT